MSVWLKQLFASLTTSWKCLSLYLFDYASHIRCNIFYYLGLVYILSTHMTWEVILRSLRVMVVFWSSYMNRVRRKWRKSPPGENGVLEEMEEETSGSSTLNRVKRKWRKSPPGGNGLQEEIEEESSRRKWTTRGNRRVLQEKLQYSPCSSHINPGTPSPQYTILNS